jgi:hypothetical protein
MAFEPYIAGSTFSVDLASAKICQRAVVEHNRSSCIVRLILIPAHIETFDVMRISALAYPGWLFLMAFVSYIVFVTGSTTSSFVMSSVA